MFGGLWQIGATLSQTGLFKMIIIMVIVKHPVTVSLYSSGTEAKHVCSILSKQAQVGARCLRVYWHLLWGNSPFSLVILTLSVRFCKIHLSVMWSNVWFWLCRTWNSIWDTDCRSRICSSSQSNGSWSISCCSRLVCHRTGGGARATAAPAALFKPLLPS